MPRIRLQSLSNTLTVSCNQKLASYNDLQLRPDTLQTIIATSMSKIRVEMPWKDYGALVLLDSRWVELGKASRSCARFEVSLLSLLGGPGSAFLGS